MDQGVTSQRTRDERIRRRVADELAWDFLIDESQIEVEVVDGVVMLVGTVGSHAEKIVAQHAAEVVEGVHDLVNSIDVKPVDDLHPSDDELRTIIEQVLTWDALVPEQHLEVSVVDGLVALTGTCPTTAQAGEAERAISRLSGVRGVLNRIQVTPPSPTPGDVRSTISEALRRRAAHQAAHIDVIVDGDRVTLRGTVSSPLERRAVIGAVGHAPGIALVCDELELVAPPPLDSSPP